MSREDFHEDFLEKAPSAIAETILVDSSHIHLVYTDQGRENLTVFIHGSPGSWSAFAEFFKNDTLLEQYDLLSIDRPGFGFSDFGRPLPDLEKQAYLLQEVIRPYAHKTIIAVGHSLGAPVAARIVMDYPGLIDAMVLVSPSIDPDLEPEEWYRDLIHTQIGGWFTPTAFWVSNEEILTLEEELHQMLPFWDNIRIPVVVIHGKDDDLVPWENAELARSLLPDSLICVIYLKDENHFIPWSRSEEIVKVLETLAP